MKRASLGACMVMIGCGPDIMVGDFDSTPCDRGDPDCTSSELVLATPSRALAAEATTMLTPRWTQPAADFAEEASAPNGGLWVFSSFRGDPFARRLDAEGVTVREVKLPTVPITAKQHQSYTTFGATFEPPSAHPLGPTVVATWEWNCPPDMRPCSVFNGPQETVVITVPEDAAQVPSVLACSRKRVSCRAPLGATRADDGQSLLLNGIDAVTAYALDGKELWRSPIYEGFDVWEDAFTPVDATHWLGYGQRVPFGDRAVLTLAEGTFDARTLRRASGSSIPSGTGKVLRTATPGAYVLVTERSTYQEELEHEDSEYGFDWDNYVAGDISVLRTRIGAPTDEPVDEHLLRRVDLPLRLDGAVIDAAGTVFVAVASATRDPAGAAVVTPLLCRFAPLGAAACFKLPQRATHLHAGAPNTVFVRTGSGTSAQLMRFDVPG